MPNTKKKDLKLKKTKKGEKKMKNIKKMSTTEKWLWIATDTLSTGALVITQLATIEGLQLPAIIITIAAAMGTTARILAIKYFGKK